jgi:hypothetical protein
MMLGKLVSPFLALFRRSELDRELDEELRFHLEREVEENIRRGMSPEGARRTAMVSFGGVEQIKEECRDVRGVRFLEDLWQDLRYSLRMLVKHPSFTVVAVITLALGIGANTAIFSVVYHVVLKPLPFHEPEQLVWVWGEQAARKQAPHTPADFLDYQQRNQSFAQMAAYCNMSLRWAVRGNRNVWMGASSPQIILRCWVSRRVWAEASRRKTDRRARRGWSC